MTFNLDGYTTVNERILDFYKQYPAGVITTQPAKVVEVGSKTFISVVARVYLDRHMEDAPVTEAEAWEVFPGATQFTRDSEMMNCATSAIGRALMQLGIGIEQGAASREEVRNRQGDTPREARKSYPASEKQIGYIKKLARDAGTTLDAMHTLGDLATICGRPDVTPTNLDGNDADRLIKALKDFHADRKPPVEDPETDPWGGLPWPEVNA